MIQSIAVIFFIFLSTQISTINHVVCADNLAYGDILRHGYTLLVHVQMGAFVQVTKYTQPTLLYHNKNHRYTFLSFHFRVFLVLQVQLHPCRPLDLCTTRGGRVRC